MARKAEPVPGPCIPVPGGMEVTVRLTPRAARDGVDGQGADPQGRPLLQVRVTAPPAEGAANAALVALVADGLRLPKRDITLVSGGTARIKRLMLRGDPAELLRRFAAWSGTTVPAPPSLPPSGAPAPRGRSWR